MRICPSCRSTYDDSVRRCPKDGHALVAQNTTLPLAPALPALETPSQIGLGREAVPDFNIEPGMMVGDYRVERVIAHGGIGIVFAAVHPIISKRVAVKVLSRRYAQDEEQISRFVLEARAVNQIGHHNIVDIFAIGELHDGRKYLVMEYLDGLEIHHILANVGRFRAGEILPIFEQLCDALAAAHDKGFVHRDLKPENITVLRRHPYPFIKILDFGIAKLRGTNQTAVGTVLGTPEYMAPEQCRAGPIDARVDIYSLGVMLYELLTGVKPFTDADPIRILAKQAREKPRRPGELAPILPEVERVILKAMAKEPAERHSSVGDLIKDLRHAIPSTLPWTASLNHTKAREHERTRTLPRASGDAKPASDSSSTYPAAVARPKANKTRALCEEPTIAPSSLGTPTPVDTTKPSALDTNTPTPVDGTTPMPLSSEPSLQLADVTTLTPISLVRQNLATDDMETQLYQLPGSADGTNEALSLADGTATGATPAASPELGQLLDRTLVDNRPDLDPFDTLRAQDTPTGEGGALGNARAPGGLSAASRPARQSRPTPTTIDFDPPAMNAASTDQTHEAAASKSPQPRPGAATVMDIPLDVANTALQPTQRPGSVGRDSVTCPGEMSVLIQGGDAADPALCTTEPLPHVPSHARPPSDTERAVPAIRTSDIILARSTEPKDAASPPQVTGSPEAPSLAPSASPGIPTPTTEHQSPAASTLRDQPPPDPDAPLFMQDENTYHILRSGGLQGARLGAVLAFLVAVGTALIVGALLLLSYGR